MVGEGLGYGCNRRDKIWLRDVNSGVFRRMRGRVSYHDINE